MDKGTQNTLIKVGIGVGAYFLIVEPILIKLGILPSKAQSQTNQQQQQALNQAAQNAYNQGGPTLDDASLINIANRVYEDLHYSAVSDDKDDAVYQLKRMQNTSDVFRLIQLFGTREECYFGFLCQDRTLIQIVQGNLSTDDIADINQTYYARGINFNW